MAIDSSRLFTLNIFLLNLYRYALMVLSFFFHVMTKSLGVLFLPGILMLKREVSFA
jgi:hypothetical protein